MSVYESGLKTHPSAGVYRLNIERFRLGRREDLRNRLKVRDVDGRLTANMQANRCLTESDKQRRVIEDFKFDDEVQFGKGEKFLGGLSLAPSLQ